MVPTPPRRAQSETLKTESRNGETAGCCPFCSLEKTSPTSISARPYPLPRSPSFPLRPPSACLSFRVSVHAWVRSPATFPAAAVFARAGKKLQDADTATVEPILSARGAAQSATDTHLTRPGASKAGGRLESRSARRGGRRCQPGVRRCPPAAPPRDRQHEQARRINKWVPLGPPRGSGAQAAAGRRGGWCPAASPAAARGLRTNSSSGCHRQLW